jgi:hypothetical protein
MEDVTIEVFIHPEWSNDITKVNFLHPKLWKDGIILFRPILDEIFLELDVPKLFFFTSGDGSSRCISPTLGVIYFSVRCNFCYFSTSRDGSSRCISLLFGVIFFN